MSKKIKLWLPDDIISKSEELIHNNAFILPDGKFVLAKGYTGCNPSHQLESSALQICRNLTDSDMQKEYENYINNNPEQNPLYYLRTMLVHYYGYALFSRVECIKSFDDRDVFYDYSILPDSKYYGKEPTLEQLMTLEKLFKINDDGTLLNAKGRETSAKVFAKVLAGERSPGNWHREF